MTDLEFDNTVKRYIGMLYRIAFNYLKNKEDSEDAIQNVFIRLFRYGKSFKSEEYLKAWLIRVTINESKRILSSNRKHSFIDIEKVANEEKTVPDAFINEKGNGVTEAFLAYARPLIQGELDPIMENGLPKHINLV